MYLYKICCKNSGPLNLVDIDMPFVEGKPIPLIIVGRNGSGKSILLSAVIDSLYEFGNKCFNNITKKSGTKYDYYKLSSFSEIKRGAKYTSSYILYKEGTEVLEYLMKTGNITFEDWKKENGIQPKGVAFNGVSDNDKHITNNKDLCKKIFDNNVYCYFSPNRFSKPFWLNKSYYSEESCLIEGNIKDHYRGNYVNPISVENSYTDNISWLLDIICDSRIDIDIKENNLNENSKEFFIPKYTNINNIILLKIARQNVDEILSVILQSNVHIRADIRGKGIERVYLVDDNNNIVLRSLDLLSTGQMALFNMFLNIIRYADNLDVNKSIHISDIKGIVIIDEAELHLHSDLQSSVMPKLLKLFPQIQFIVSSHSPLFILGMNKIYGEGNIQIRELPENELIQPEEFSQFNSAFKTLKETKLYRNEINAIKSVSTDKPLIITEGASDWLHIKNAIAKLKQSESLSSELKEKIKKIDVLFLEYYPKNSDKNFPLKLQMGDSALITMCEQFSKIYHKRKYIFIADHDNKETINRLNDTKRLFKDWGNNVYSFCIPIPDNRKVDNICIELYYEDSDLKILKNCKDGIKRRIFLSNEFDENGINFELNKKSENIEICKNKEKIFVLDGSKHKRVFSYNLLKELGNTNITSETNFGLSKISYAESIISNDSGFEKISVNNFIKIIEIIYEILK